METYDIITPTTSLEFKAKTMAGAIAHAFGQGYPDVLAVINKDWDNGEMKEKQRRLTENLNLVITDCSMVNYWETGGTGDKSDYINKSYISGNEIILGIYDNPEFRSISFFHEVGHFLSHKLLGDSEYENERIAWEVGFAVAASHGIFFSEEAEEFANDSLDSYEDEMV